MVAAWITYIKGRVSQNKNFIGFIGGPTGSGKSWTSLAIAEQADPKFSIDQVVFSAKALMEVVNGGKLKKGSVIIFEEAGVALSNRNWQGVINKVINYLFQTFRHKNYILIMNSPYMDFVDKSTRKLIHAELQVESIDRKNQQTIIKPQIIQYNGRKDKFYFKYLRVKVAGVGTKVVKRWGVPKPTKDLRRAYEAKKTAYTKGLNEDIMKQLIAKEEADKPKEEWICQDCKHEWVPRSKSPSKCPKCQKYDTPTLKSAISN